MSEFENDRRQQPGIDALLADRDRDLQPGLGRARQQAILDAVLAQVNARDDDEPSRPEVAANRHGPGRSGWWGVTSAVAAAAAVALVVLRPTPEAAVEADSWAARGDGDAATLAPVCRTTGAVGICARGMTLLLELGNTRRWSHAAAFAEAPGGRRLWYVPEADATSLPLQRGDHQALVPVEIELGPEHASGSYDVVVVLSKRSLSRSEALAGYAGQRHDVEVVRSRLVVR